MLIWLEWPLALLQWCLADMARLWGARRPMFIWLAWALALLRARLAVMARPWSARAGREA